MTAVTFRVEGVVQGVGFRAFTSGRAANRGLAGWCLNTEDGAVEGHVEGPADEVEAFLHDLRRGPRAARVDELATQPADVQGHHDFSVRR